MTKVFFNFNSEATEILKRGGVGVIPTDTIYGIVGSALSSKTVNRIYRLRHRRPDKPMIILIGSLNDLKMFGIKPDAQMKTLLKKFWPGKVSVILSCSSKKFSYLHRGTSALAFRLPAFAKATVDRPPLNLRKLLKKTGPLVAPSANLEDKPPAKTIKEAQKYFGKKIDFYIDDGKIVRESSTLVKLQNGKIVVLRK